MGQEQIVKSRHRASAVALVIASFAEGCSDDEGSDSSSDNR
jgi:hypothetical protein